DVRDVALRVPGAPPVVVDQCEPPRQLLEDAVQQRVLPFHPQVAERHPGDEDQCRAIAGDGEGEAHAVRAAGIADTRHGPHSLTLSPGRAMIRTPRAPIGPWCPCSQSDAM